MVNVLEQMNMSILWTFENDNSKGKENKGKVVVLKEPIFSWQEITSICGKFQFMPST